MLQCATVAADPHACLNLLKACMVPQLRNECFFHNMNELLAGELPITMLACARIGAVHSVVFAGFSAESLASRVEDCKSRVVVTTSGVMRGKKKLGTKAIVDDALKFSKREGFEVTLCCQLL